MGDSGGSVAGERSPDGFDPFDRAVNGRLMRKALCIARRLGLPEDEGPAACQDLLVRILKGDRRLLASEALFVCALRRRLQDAGRRWRRSSSLDSLLPGAGRDGERWDRVEALSLVNPPDGERRLLEGERQRREEALRAVFARAIRRLPEGRRVAFLARLRGRILRSGGGVAVADFEHRFEIALGPHGGTASLAAALSASPGSVACDANRGEKRLVQELGQLLAQL
jgi:DNA-directed RNA polymerase specialized sigma24 family protein